MVTFQLVSEDDQFIIYWYFPEGGEDHGVITVDKEMQTAEIASLAPKDFSRTISVDELNSLRDSVNSMRVSEGMPELTEEEWPSATESAVSTFYADHVINRLSEAFNAGEKLEYGTVAFY